MLPERDADFIARKVKGAFVVAEAGMIAVVIPHFPLPPGLSADKADLLLRLSPGYPDVPPDMWWFSPPVRRSDNAPIPATEVFERHLDKTWQRWSRHLSPDQWRSGTDTLETYVSMIRHQLLCAASRRPDGSPMHRSEQDA